MAFAGRYDPRLIQIFPASALVDRDLHDRIPFPVGKAARVNRDVREREGTNVVTKKLRGIRHGLETEHAAGGSDPAREKHRDVPDVRPGIHHDVAGADQLLRHHGKRPPALVKPLQHARVVQFFQSAKHPPGQHAPAGRAQPVERPVFLVTHSDPSRHAGTRNELSTSTATACWIISTLITTLARLLTRRTIPSRPLNGPALTRTILPDSR